MYRIIAVAVLVFLSELVFFTPSAYADNNTFDCSAYASVMSRFLFNYLGSYVTDGPVLISVTECVHKSGIYSSAFLSAPLQNFDNGKEVDVRGGYRFSTLGLDADVSAAWYYFGIGVAENFQTLDLQVRLGHTFSIGSSTKLELYGIAEHQHSLTLDADSLFFAGGVAFAVDLPVPGTPNLKLGAEVWKYALSPDPGKGPIGSFTADLGFKIPGSAEIVVGPRAQFTVGDVDKRHSADFRKSFGIFVSIPFGF